MLSKTGYAGTVTMPPLPLLVNGSRAFFNCPNIEKVFFTGASDICSALDYCCYAMPKLNEVTMPSSLNYAGINLAMFFSSMPSLTKVTLPLSMSGLAVGFDIANVIPNPSLLQISECLNWGPNVLSSSSMQLKWLPTFKQSSLKLQSFPIGYNNDNSAFTGIDIDWANCVIASGVNLFGSMPAAEINRIFSLLPTVVGKTINVKGNPGAATCNQSIATAKGWTVVIV
jgi:hypothetical protein